MRYCVEIHSHATALENPVRYEPDVAGALDGSQPALGPSFVALPSEPTDAGLARALVPARRRVPKFPHYHRARLISTQATRRSSSTTPTRGRRGRSRQNRGVKIAACAKSNFDRHTRQPWARLEPNSRPSDAAGGSVTICVEIKISRCVPPTRPPTPARSWDAVPPTHSCRHDNAWARSSVCPRPSRGDRDA